MSNVTESSLESIEIERLLELLPHRYPFLMIDRIRAIDGDASGIGIKNVTFNEPHFQGHFPGDPIMPGVLLVEGMAQTAGAICAHKHYDGSPKGVFFMTIDRAKFRKPVRPGDVVEFHIEKQNQKRNVFKYQCVAKVNETKVAEAEIGAMMLVGD